MNPIRIALLALLLLNIISSAKASYPPTKDEIKKFNLQIHQKLKAFDFQNKCGEKRLSVFFMVDSKGKICEANVLSRDQQIKASLESDFKKICLLGFPPNTLCRVDLHFVVY